MSQGTGMLLLSGVKPAHDGSTCCASFMLVRAPCGARWQLTGLLRGAAAPVILILPCTCRCDMGSSGTPEQRSPSKSPVPRAVPRRPRSVRCGLRGLQEDVPFPAKTGTAAACAAAVLASPGAAMQPGRRPTRARKYMRMGAA